RWGAIARAQLFGLTGRADRTIVSAFATSDLEEQRTIQLGHDLAIGGEGLRVGALFTHAWANPAIAGDSDLKARSLLATLYADYPIVRSLGLTFRGSIGFDLVNQDVDFNGRGISEDRLRTGFVRLAMDALGASGDRRLPGEPLWQFNGFIELRKGLDILRASHACGAIPSSCDGVPPSRPSAVSTAAIVRTFLNAEFHPAPMVTFSLAASGQYAWKPLGSFEEFSAGNYTVGRGYDPGALLGDRGWGTQAEIRLGSTVPASVRKPAVEGYVFFDHARVRALDGMAPVGPRHLYSTGAGVRVTYDRFVLDGSLAVPLTQLGEADEKPDPRLLVSVTTRLWPWRYR
ncbi:MAG TPA: ShlB/FhaC/HecB family hemolysin secretion/activation protein, partial [Sphingomicrobium sp.]|nr:ShlB/FhaC/HecB family hemolysin secretion/activation protein [Sphingomicrobium sp.]